VTKYEEFFSQYGIVKIIDGEFKGRFVYYDDDDIDYDDKEKAVVYFGDIIYNSRYEYIDYEYLDWDYTFDDLKKRSDEIVELLWKKISDSERTILVEEKNMIDMEIISRLENFIESNNGKNKKIFLYHSSSKLTFIILYIITILSFGLLPVTKTSPSFVDIVSPPQE